MSPTGSSLLWSVGKLGVRVGLALKDACIQSRQVVLHLLLNCRILSSKDSRWGWAIMVLLGALVPLLWLLWTWPPQSLMGAGSSWLVAFWQIRCSSDWTHLGNRHTLDGRLLAQVLEDSRYERRGTRESAFPCCWWFLRLASMSERVTASMWQSRRAVMDAPAGLLSGEISRERDAWNHWPLQACNGLDNF